MERSSTLSKRQLSLDIGTRVLVNGAIGTVRFIGTTDFSAGKWVGIELDTPSGKNNGFVGDKKYFECRHNHGIFVRPTLPKIIDQGVQAADLNLEQPLQPEGQMKPPQAVPRSMPVPRLNTSTSQLRSPTPSGLRSPSPRKSILQTSQYQTSSPIRQVQRASLPASVNTSAVLNQSGQTRSASSQSSIGRSQSSLRGLLSISGPKVEHVSVSSVDVASHELVKEITFENVGQNKRASSLAITRSTSPVANRNPSSTSKEVEELAAKLRIFEQKRADDRKKIKELEQAATDRESWESIRSKLQTKMASMQSEIKDLRKSLDSAEEMKAVLESKITENTEVVEMATLDREMAEERSEVLQMELAALKERMEELSIENDILKAENGEMNRDVPPEERTSAGWLQLEKQNERLREALMRLRDVTSANENKLKEDLKEFEMEVSELQGFRGNASEKIERLEGTVDELRVQLDAALGAEEMLEELTEKNMSMSEKIEEMKLNIEDLEALREVNDELDINHVEAEKQLIEELDHRDILIREQAKRIRQSEEMNLDYENMIGKFRELVASLQSDIEELRQAQKSSETETKDLSSRTRAMMELNSKLQKSSNKAQVKAIELEMRKLEALEAVDQLSMIQAYLFSFEDERVSIEGLLRLKRISFKSNLLLTFLHERHSSETPGKTDEDLIALTDICDKLVWISGTSKRFVVHFSNCSAQEFTSCAGIQYEVEPIEKTLSRFLNQLKTDDFKETHAVEELGRSLAILTHLAENHVMQLAIDLPEEYTALCSILQGHMDSVTFTLELCERQLRKRTEKVEECEEQLEHWVSLVAHAKTSRVQATKLGRVVDDLKVRSLALEPESIQKFQSAASSCRQLAFIGKAVVRYLANAREEGKSFSFYDLQCSIQDCSKELPLDKQSNPLLAFDKWVVITTESLVELNAIAHDLNRTHEFDGVEVAPWIFRARNVKDAKVTDIDTTEKLSRTQAEVKELIMQLRLKDKYLEESSVQIDLLKSRMGGAKKQFEQLTQLEADLANSATRAKQYEEMIENLNSEIQNLEEEAAKWKKMASEAKPSEFDTNNKDSTLNRRSLIYDSKALLKEIHTLKEAIRFLQEHNYHLRITEDLQWLQEPLLKKYDEEVVTLRQQTLENGRHLDILKFTTSCTLVDLKSTPQPGTGWKSIKKLPQYKHLRQQENFECLRARQNTMIEKLKNLPWRVPLHIGSFNPSNHIAVI
ncbi:Dynactin, isoform [Neolecta irregularis DAH-3]|uniref:Dynactin, isoform n=1 Tax=Neolecta irregularis (strain DAH-3) TaxID=1198029 RepID=A0A1U7LI80_NEOID|nr:Dynactin, isoform [Neolecta irregularis DAH-3]|eukprot:OLL22303.1 Dynactin, isoform [Neolecta irregularis DAH-3]